MFKKLLMGLGAFAMVLVVLFRVIGGRGEKQLAEFFTRIRSASTADVQGMLAPAVRDIVDPELMAEMVKHVATDFGGFRSVRTNGMRFESKFVNGHWNSEFEGVFVFEKKEVHLEVDFRGEQLSGLLIKDQAAAKEVLARVPPLPKDTKPYAKRGDEFLRAVITKKADVAWPMLNEQIQKQVGRQGFDKQLASLKEPKTIEEITVKAARPEKGDPTTLEVIYQCRLDGQSVRGHVSFQFLNLKGHLIGFGLPTDRAD